jgi:molybdopterin synthase sulfur carrier subunit
MARVFIPTVMRKCVNGRPSFDVSGKTVGEVFASVYRDFPALATEVLDKDGKIKPFIAIFINGTSLRDMENQSAMRDEDEIYFVPAIAGGLD